MVQKSAVLLNGPMPPIEARTPPVPPGLLQGGPPPATDSLSRIASLVSCVHAHSMMWISRLSPFSRAKTSTGVSGNEDGKEKDSQWTNVNGTMEGAIEKSPLKCNCDPRSQTHQSRLMAGLHPLWPPLIGPPLRLRGLARNLHSNLVSSA